jgi:hypothetical protein
MVSVNGARRARLSCALAGVVLLAMLPLPAVAAAFHGSLSSVDGGIVGTGNWLVTGPTTLEWWVTQNGDGSWHYKYVFSHPVGATSHFILEASASIEEPDIFGILVGFTSFDIGSHLVQSGNPGMPESLFGIKFGGTAGITTTIEFDCTRRPVWGDFYSKDGSAGGYGVNAAWNAGFTVADTDPSDSPQDGTVGGHTLVPDTVSTAPVRAVTWTSVKAMYR